MTIRKARRSDLRALAEVAAAAFMNEELWGILMHPHRKEYPEDFVQFFERKLLSKWYDSNRHFLVGLDKLSGKVIAFAVWQRQGASTVGSTSWSNYLNLGKEASVMMTLDISFCLLRFDLILHEYGYLREILIRRRLITLLVDKIMCNAVSYGSQVSSYIWPNRAADPTKTSVLQDSFPLFSNFWSGSRQQNWYLDMLATHPNFQGHGIGKELVKWGIGEADRENVSASVISSDGNEGFYGKSGFIEVGRANVGPLKENGIRGGAIMFRDTKEVQIIA